MKKFFLTVMIVTMMLVLTACGSKDSLTCKAEHNGITREYYMEFDKEKATNVTLRYSVDFEVAGLEDFGCSTMEECLKMAEYELQDCQKDDEFDIRFFLFAES